MGALRLLLAMSVVFVHTSGIFNYTVAGGTAAVQMFFIVSGFFMSQVLTSKYDPQRQIWTFYASRAMRIYSTYFCCLVLAMGLNLLAEGYGRSLWIETIRSEWGSLDLFSRTWLIGSTFSIFGLDWLNFFQLGDGGFVLGASPLDPKVWALHPIPPAWSISLELMFYVMCPFLVRLRTRYLILLVGLGLLARAFLYAYGLKRDPWTYRFFPLELPLFLLGILSDRLYSSGILSMRAARSKMLALGLIAITLMTQPLAFAVKKVGLSELVVYWVLYAYAVVSLPHLFALTSKNKLDRYVGNFSYPIYLVHWPIIVLYDATMFRGEVYPSPARTLVCAFAALFAAWIIMVLIELPVDRLRHRRFVGQLRPAMPRS
ncbi:acyltransferase [Bradyrhizobium manausense]|uniref:acyltransferase family protein n=1 Tax=Bradyrhizobium manausense TaxID=989370 RepID=UPI001BA96F0F|nr:acyltransferase [Bradyrhizobium manausense]MBR0829863.1 acyltransferase [Bradyrhizobium manausense]